MATADPPRVISAPVEVFPLRNATGDAGLDWVSIGLQDSLTVDLWYVSALQTISLAQTPKSVQAVCPDPTLTCVAGQNWAVWNEQAKAYNYGGFLWGEYRRDGDAWVLRLSWYSPDGDAPLAERTVRGVSLPELLTAATEGLQALLADYGIAVLPEEQARMNVPKTRVAAAWEQNAQGYWEQIRFRLAADEAQRTARAAVWERHLSAAVAADPDYAEAWNNLGYQHFITRDRADAQAAFERALKIKPTLIDALIGRGKVFQTQEKPTEALPWYERAVALNPSLANHRKILLDTYVATSQPAAGLAQLAALNAHLQRYAREDERTALYAWRIAYHTELKQWPQVLVAYRNWDEALARSEDRASRDKRVELANKLFTFGFHRKVFEGAFQDTEVAYRLALEIVEEVAGPNHLGVAWRLRVLALLYKNQGRYAEAEPPFKRALAIWEKAPDPNPSDVANGLNDLALLYQDQGHYAEAKPLFKRALAIWEKAPDPNPSDVATGLNNLALLYQVQGHYAEAEPLFMDALKISEQSLDPNRSDMAPTLNNLASLYQAQGRYAEAEPLFKDALKINKKALGPGHPDVATSLNNLASLYQDQGHYTEAERLLLDALKINKKALGPGHPDVAFNLNNLASLYQDQGHYTEAEQFFRKALAIVDQADRPLELMVINENLGYLLVQQNRLTKAIAPYDTAVRTLDRLFANTRGLSEEARYTFIGQYASIYRGFIDLLLKLHDQNNKAGYDRKALEVVSRQQSRVFTELLRQSQVRIYEHDSGFQEKKAQRDSLREQVSTLTGQWATVPLTAPEAEAKKASLGQLRDEKRQALAEVDARLQRDYPRFIELEQPAPVTVETLQALLQPGEAVWTVALLPEQTVLFVVTHDQFHLERVAVGQTALTNLVARLRQPLDRAVQLNNYNYLQELDPADLHQLYQYLIAPVTDYLQTAHRVLVVADGLLYNLPLELLVTHFTETDVSAFRDARRAPENPLLGEYATLDYLDTHYRFHYLPSLAALVSQRPPVTASASPTPPAIMADASAPLSKPVVSPLIAFADPVFGPETPSDTLTSVTPPTSPACSAAAQTTLRQLTHSSALRRLPESADEARALANLLHAGDPALYLRQCAQEQTVYDLNDQGQLRRARYLLFSTHGLLGGQFLPPDTPAPSKTPHFPTGVAPPTAPQDASEPALALTLVGDLHGQDGFLKMGEILGLNLNTELVILSACNTAGQLATEQNHGEGFVGLTRAFLSAGARHLWVSHWNVASGATRDLVVAAFTALQAGQSPADALAIARQQLRQQTHQSPGAQAVAHAHPYFWAPFVVVGD
ncbi:MAG: tetratricopeptide repeat protein [Gammaproteobacteria bacterium]|nr:tetratricopeptide repeat protein [Gammaproteobacteria bacterium]